VCRDCYKIRRKEESVDAVVEGVVIARLSQPDGPDLLAGDPEALRAATDELAALEARLALAADQYADGGITGEQLHRITARLRPRIDAARATVRASAPSPELAPLAGSDVAATWARANIETKRAVIDLLMSVTILPTRPGRSFDPETVRIDWKA
jgi:hypothetical protein